ncbi:PD40 domain-containing protein [Nafulsella turpanensis]|uniref:PD40 domain-containing protein n=1 Tax=Nafulsella turpanensis TaxID=1265690 RepID=UPI000375E248|nr:PD40 domain-containing protein [Nafulsella turpanensis]
MSIQLSFAQAQTRSFLFDIKGPAAKGRILFKEENYKEAIPYLEQALQTGRKSADLDLQRKLAFAYAQAGSAKAAAELYTRIVGAGVALENEHLMLYANALMASGKIEEGKRVLARYLKDEGVVERIRILETKLSEESLYRDTIRYSIRPVSINTKGAEFSPYVLDHGVIFVSDKPRAGLIKQHFTADDSYGLDLVYGRITDGGDISDLTRLSSTVNTAMPEGPGVVYNKGRKLLFTRSGEKHQMQLYEATTTFNPTSWVKVKPLNLKVASAVGHPAVADNGRVIYFVSDMPGGFGGTDIYRVEKQGNDWTPPQNLGPLINTSGNEMFPTLLGDDKLYFSSNGRFGLGGLDIYEALLAGDSVIHLRNMGVPFNSAGDDFGLSFHHSGNWGYFSSSRKGGAGEDDIYRVDVHVITLAGRVYDAVNEKGIEGTRISLWQNRQLIDETMSDQRGEYAFRLYPGEEYELVYEREEYRAHQETLSTVHGPRYGIRSQSTGLERKVKMFVLGTIRKSNKERAAGAHMLVVEQLGEGIDTVYADERGNYDLELDVKSKYTFLVSCEEEMSLSDFSTPEIGKASLSYYENLNLLPVRPYRVEGQVNSNRKGSFVISLFNSLTLSQEYLLTDEEGTFSFEAHPLADYEICLMDAPSTASVYLKGGWHKAVRNVRLRSE